MSKLESSIQATIIKYLKTLPNLYFEKSIVTNRRGSPDIKICYKGRFIALEVKSEKGEPTELQHFMLSTIKNAGGIAEIVRSLSDVKAILNIV